MKVCKFGGSSLADAAQLNKVIDIVLADPARRIVVVSAPGKRPSRCPRATISPFAGRRSSSSTASASPRCG